MPPEPIDIAKLIEEQYNFLLLKETDDLLIYDSGIFRRDEAARTIIRAQTEYLTRRKCSEHFRQEVFAHIKANPEVLVSLDALNAKLGLVATKNCVLDIISGEVFEPSPKFRLRWRLPISYKLGAKCPSIHEFLKSSVPDPDRRATLLETLASAVLGKPRKRKALFLYGLPDSGKSTWLNICNKFLGPENTAHEKLSDIAGSDRFSMAQLFNARANIYADLKDTEISSTGDFKALTGCDVIPAQFKYGQKFDFLPSCEFMFSANKLPMIKEEFDTAWWQRWRLVEFPFTFSRDDNEHKAIEGLDDLVMSESEMSGLLNVIIGITRTRTVPNKFSYEPKPEETKEIWINNADFKRRFLLESFIEKEDSILPRRLPFEMWEKHAAEKGYAIGSDKALYQKLRSTFLSVLDTSVKAPKSARAWKGIMLKDSAAHLTHFSENQESMLDHFKRGE